MKRVLAALVCALALVGAAPAPEPAAGGPVIRIWGPEAMRGVAERWAAGYRAGHPGVRFELVMKGSDTAIPGLYAGKADLALMGRSTTITDDNGFGRVKGYAPTRIELFGASLASPGKAPALAVLVPADNPLRSITMAQLRALLGCDGQAARTWGDLGLGGKWRAMPVHVHMPDAGSNTGRFIEDTVLGGGRKLNWAAITEYPIGNGAADPYPRIAAAVRADPGALGLGLPGEAAGLRAVPVVAEAGAPAVYPDRAAMIAGRYPLGRHAFGFIDLKPGTAISPVLQSFLRYALGAEGQALAAQGGDWLPLPPATTARSLASLAAPGESSPSAAALTAVEALPPYRPSAPVSGTISMWGHGSFKRDFMGRLVQRWFAEFRAHHPNVTLDYRMYGTASAIGALATDAGNLALLGEEISPDQLRQFVRAKGYAPTAIEIANGSLATPFFDYAHMIFVHRDNPLTRLTVRQVEAIFGAEHRCAPGNIRTWGELGLGGEWAGQPIVPYSWETDTDFAQLLRERALCGSHRWNPATREVYVTKKPDGSAYDLGQQLVDALARDRFGLAVSNTLYQTAAVRPLAISAGKGAPYVMPSDATLIDRTYPLGRILPAYVDRQPGGRITPVVAEFLRYVLSREGQRALVEESAYLPLSAPVAARERAKLP